ALRNEGTKKFGELQLELVKKLEAKQISQRDAQYEVEKFWVSALRRAVRDGDIKYGSLMAGQSVGLVNEIKSVKEIINEFITEAEAEVARLSR
ncbi:MAG: hypothetical protein AAB019_06530, partial [Planctomycetota bacterium]